jgi:hypothetical protein
MSMSVFQISLLTAGLVFLIGGAVLAVIASRIAAAGRTAQIEAEIRLASSQELAAEVKRLVEKVELSLVARDAAIENAFLRHNDACMASVQSTLASHGTGGCTHHETGSTQFSGGPHDENGVDAQHEIHNAANDEVGRPSFFARLFRRYP